jgi:hypothetical protein
MYRDMGIKPGDRIGVKIGDEVVLTDAEDEPLIVQSVRYSSAEPEIVRRLSRWQRMVRALTPRRFRKSLVVREAKPATVTVSTEPGGDPMGYTAARLAEMKQGFGKLL